MVKQCGMSCLWWDNNTTGYGGEHFGIFDRNSKTFICPDIADAMIKVYGKSEQPSGGNSSGGTTTTDKYISLFYGKAKSSNWGQAVDVATKRVGGEFDAGNIKRGGHFYVEYSGTEGELELILQSMSGGADWAKVSPSEKGKANGHFFAKYSYENYVSAYGSDNFSGTLDKIYVGATNKSVTVFSLCYDLGEAQYGSDHTPNSGSTNSDAYESLFWGSSGAGQWEQAVSVITAKNGGKFDSNKITSGGYFYVEYSGSQYELELILQSWSGGSKWAKINAYEHGTANGNYYAKFSRSDIIEAFGSDLYKLDQIHVGAMNGNITVYSVCYCYPA